MNWWPLLLFAGFMGFIALMTFTKYGRGKSLGGKIIWSGEEHVVDESKFTHGKEVLLIHTIETSKSHEESKVGIEFRSKSAMHFNMIPITLDLDQARKIKEELDEAIRRADA